LAGSAGAVDSNQDREADQLEPQRGRAGHDAFQKHHEAKGLCRVLKGDACPVEDGFGAIDQASGHQPPLPGLEFSFMVSDPVDADRDDASKDETDGRSDSAFAGFLDLRDDPKLSGNTIYRFQDTPLLRLSCKGKRRWRSEMKALG